MQVSTRSIDTLYETLIQKSLHYVLENFRFIVKKKKKHILVQTLKFTRNIQQFSFSDANEALKIFCFK